MAEIHHREPSRGRKSLSLSFSAAAKRAAKRSAVIVWIMRLCCQFCLCCCFWGRSFKENVLILIVIRIRDYLSFGEGKDNEVEKQKKKD